MMIELTQNLPSAAVQQSVLSLAYRPFVEPLNLHTHWLALLPVLAVAIALIYKTIKLDDLKDLPRETAALTGQIMLFMAVAAAVLWLVTELA
jgi:hypothetical protein